MKAVLILSLLLFTPQFTFAEHESHGSGEIFIDVLENLEEATASWKNDTLMPFPKALEPMFERGFRSCSIRGRDSMTVLLNIYIMEKSCQIDVSSKMWMDLKWGPERWRESCRNLMEQFGVDSRTATVRCEMYYIFEETSDTVG